MKKPGETKYYLIKEDIKRRIVSGKYKFGERIETEVELCDLYSVSRITAKRALDELMYEGYIRRVGGSGNFVSFNPINHILNGFYSLSEEIKKRDMVPTSKLVCLKELTVKDIDIANELKLHLKLRDYDHVFFLQRLRYADDEIIALDYTYLPVMFVPSLVVSDFESPSVSLYSLMGERYDCEPERAQEYFGVCTVLHEDAQLLNVSANSPALRVVRISFSKGNPVEYNYRIYKGEKYKYRIDLQKH